MSIVNLGNQPQRILPVQKGKKGACGTLSELVLTLDADLDVSSQL